MKNEIGKKLLNRLDSLIENIKNNVPEESLDKEIPQYLSFKITKSKGFQAISITPRKAITLVEKNKKEIIKDTKTDILGFGKIFFEEESLQKMLGIGILEEKWRWSYYRKDDEEINPVSALRLLIHFFGKNIENHENVNEFFPSDIEENEIIHWINNCSKIRDLNIESLDSLRRLEFKDENDKTRSCPLSSFFWFYIAFKKTHESTPFIALDACNESRQLNNAMAYEIKQRQRPVGKSRKETTLRIIKREDCSLYLQKEDGSLCWIAMKYSNEDDFHSVVIEAFKKHLSSVCLRHWIALQSLWSIQGGRTGSVLWTLDTHLEALGYSKSSRKKKKLRQEVSREVATLSNLALVYIAKNNKEKLEIKLMNIGDSYSKRDNEKGEWSLEGCVLTINQAFYKGVREIETGKLGKNYWPVPQELAHIDHRRYPNAIALGVSICQRLRFAKNESKESIKLKGSNILEMTGRKKDTKREKSLFAKIEKDLDELQRKNVIGSYKWSKGGSGQNEMIEIFPSDFSLKIIKEGYIGSSLVSQCVPYNGKELKEWRTRRSITQEELALSLGISRKTVSRMENNTEPIKSTIRKKLEEFQIS